MTDAAAVSATTEVAAVSAEPEAPLELPAPPRVSAAIRAAVTDFYFNSWRLVPANLLWGVTFLLIVVAGTIVPAALFLAPVLALPAAWVFRIAGLIGRGEPASFWDGAAAWRSPLPVLLLGVAFGASAAIFIGNIAIGITSDAPIGWAIATLAFWGLVVEWLLAWTVWPLLFDPTRAGRPVRDRLRLAVLLVLAHPRQIGGLGLVCLVCLVASTVAFVALLTISVAFTALVAARYVLPAADRLEARLAAGPAEAAPRTP
jgi:hypothetical protein